MFPPPFCRDVLEALRLLEGRLQGSGRRLSPCTLELRSFAERSLAIWSDQCLAEEAVGVNDDEMTLCLMTFEEAADRLRVAEVTVRRLVASGQLPAVSLGRARRIRPSDLQAFIESLGRKTETQTEKEMA